MKKNNIEPVKNFDLNNYLGLWYEIARLPNSFEKGLEEITAEYFLNSDGTVKVVNSGFRADKDKRDYGFAKAWLVSDSTIGNLRVQFFWPFKAHYKIILLDEGYQYAVVTGAGYNYLWILSRAPHMNELVLHQLIDTCTSWNFDTQKLIFPIHSL